jgi:hypothetical protein
MAASKSWSLHLGDCAAETSWGGHVDQGLKGIAQGLNVVTVSVADVRVVHEVKLGFHEVA